MRPFQKEALEQIEKGFNSARFVILEAPVGFGKSAIATSFSRYYGSAHILTATKQLQGQYAKDFGIPIVKGKPNFRCNIPTSTRIFLPCNRGRCEAEWSLKDCPHFMTFEEYNSHKRKLCDRGSKCERLKDRRLCSYYAQKWFGFFNPITVYNYSFLLSELKYAKDVPHRRLLVCDEVHDLEKQIVSFASFSFGKLKLQSFYDEVKPQEKFIIPNKGIEDPALWLEVLHNIKDILKEFCELRSETEHEYGRIVICKELLEEFENFSENLKSRPSNWVVNRLKVLSDGSVEEVVFQPIDVGDYTNPLFEIANSVLLMSATVFSKERLCKVLGIQDEEAIFIPITESSFPVENRPIYALNSVRLNRKSMETALSNIVEVIDKILTNHSGERGVIHTTSYMQSNYIMKHLPESNRDRLVTTEGSFDRSSLVDIHSSNVASVLISPSLYQGIDLKDESSRFQVIVKVPYPDLSMRRILVKLQMDRNWYDWQTAQRLVQTYGRSVRSEEDHAITYVLDSNFTYFIEKNRYLFPKFFLDALIENKELP
jgi:Rad3-related DNA helicase